MINKNFTKNIDMIPVLSKMHQNSAIWQKFGLNLKRPHKRHIYQTCHGGSPSQDLKDVVGNCEIYV